MFTNILLAKANHKAKLKVIEGLKRLISSIGRHYEITHKAYEYIYNLL